MKNNSISSNLASQKPKPRIVIMAGGTGGHVFPALAIAEEALGEGIEVLWLGTQDGMEAELVPKANIPIRFISVRGVRRHGILRKMLAPFYIFWAILQALMILLKFKPQIVLGMGGYVAGPGGVAAWLLRIPLVIHEQNAIAGVTNQILARLAVTVLQGFPESFPCNPKAKKATAKKAIWVGNPVRSELTGIPEPKIRFKIDETKLNTRLKLLVLGGSRGALAINQLLPEALARIPIENRPEVWHQTGKPHLSQTTESYKQVGLNSERSNSLNYKIEAFINNMTEAYTWADLVICRAGASTVSELACVGVGSLLIPFPFAVDDHQTHNGLFLERAGAAKILKQSLLDPQTLADIINSFSKDKSLVLKMAMAARGLAKPDATKTVVSFCKEWF